MHRLNTETPTPFTLEFAWKGDRKIGASTVVAIEIAFGSKKFVVHIPPDAGSQTERHLPFLYKSKEILFHRISVDHPIIVTQAKMKVFYGDSEPPILLPCRIS